MNLGKQLTEILSDYLSRDDEGRKLVKLYRRNRAKGAAQLNEYLRQQLADDPDLAGRVISVLSEGGGDSVDDVNSEDDGQITNVIEHSQIDQVISIANLDDLTIQTTKHFFFFHDLRQLVTFVLIPLVTVLTISGGWYGYRWYSSQPVPAPDDIDAFNIVIAQFGQVTADGIKATEKTRRFAVILCHYLDNEIKENNYDLKIHVDHQNMPVITEDAQAARLAKRLNSDLIVYGNVTLDGETGTFLPSFYVSNRTNDVEVGGYNQFARPIRFNTNADSEEELTRILRTRAAILVNYIKGLVYLNHRQRTAEMVEAAEYAFQQAVNEAETLEEPFQGQEVLYLMLSYVQKMGERYDEALLNLDKALELNPEYARALIGLGNIYYTQFVNGDDDPILLDQAWDYYQWAMEAKDRPPSAYIDTKAMIGFGNVQIMRVRHTRDLSLLDDAIQRYQWVVKRHEQLPGDRGLARLVAYAYRNLGWVYDLKGEFTAAEKAYRRCFALSTDTVMKDKCKEEIEVIQNR